MPEENTTQTPPQTSSDAMEDSPGAMEEGALNIQKIGNFISLFGILMLSMAIFLDFIGFILLVLSFFGIGIPLSFIPDLIGLVFIGGLMFLSPSGGIVLTKGADKLTKTLAKKIGKKLGLSFIGELIPFFGDAMPCWTLAVYFHLKGS